jgi:hypothetical protein
MAADDPYVELRGEFLREHVDVIDAIAQCRPGSSRMSILRDIVAAWVEQRVHEASVITRVHRGNGTMPDGDRSRVGKRGSTAGDFSTGGR